MNSEEDEFRRIEAEAKRRVQDDDDDTQGYTSEMRQLLAEAYRCGVLAGAEAEREACAKPCIGKDPRCPCQDGDACHYKDCGSTKALPAAQPEQEPVAKLFGTLPVFDTPPAAQCTWVGLTDEDWDHIDNTNGTSQDTFIQGAAWAAARLKERNNG